MFGNFMKTVALATAAAFVAANGAQAGIGDGVLGARGPLVDNSQVENVQYLFGGRNYCWYPNGWRGPGWYWCGFSNRRGLGWGGATGWNGWGSGAGSNRWRHGTQSPGFHGGGFPHHGDWRHGHSGATPGGGFHGGAPAHSGGGQPGNHGGAHPSGGHSGGGHSGGGHGNGHPGGGHDRP
jgi:hypothetical protein